MKELRNILIILLVFVALSSYEHLEKILNNIKAMNITDNTWGYIMLGAVIIGIYLTRKAGAKGGKG